MMDGRVRVWPWNSFTLGVILLIFISRLIRWCSSRFRSSSAIVSTPNFAATPCSAVPLPQDRVSPLISDSDLKNLLDELKDKIHMAEDWETVIERGNGLFSYSAKRTKPKDGPVKYMSVTVFENCSPELLRNFYMDNDFRKTWDKTLIEHHQLSLDVSDGTEVGRTIKRFPFLAAREYVLSWRVWEDKYGAFYCFTKECEHPLAPRQKKYVRVMFHRSGWRIRKVENRNACEIRMVHQEDAGLNVELAKLAFAKGIWTYVCKMNDALRLYSFQRTPTFDAPMLIQKFPAQLEGIDDTPSTTYPEFAANGTCCQQPSEGHVSRSSKTPSKFLKNGLNLVGGAICLTLVGGAICLTRGHSNIGAKVTMVYILTKLNKHRALAKRNKAAKP